MTSALSMQTRRTDPSGRRARFTAIGALLVILMIGSGCARERLHEPAFLQSPYERPQVWAVAPFTNESGVSSVDSYRIADLFAQQVQDIHGVHVVPVNRVILAMRELDMIHVTGPSDARMLMSALGVDGLLVGTITAYDPYRPMTLGAAIELHLTAENVAFASAAQPDLDTWQLTRSPTADFAPAQFRPTRANPVAQAAGVFDATNHRTLSQLDHYSNGRSVPDGAYGRDIYLVSMDMYTQFVSFRLLRDLLHAERMRVIAEAVNQPDDAPARERVR